jgi:hypothetical protein
MPEAADDTETTDPIAQAAEAADDPVRGAKAVQPAQVAPAALKRTTYPPHRTFVHQVGLTYVNFVPFIVAVGLFLWNRRRRTHGRTLDATDDGSYGVDRGLLLMMALTLALGIGIPNWWQDAHEWWAGGAAPIPFIVITILGIISLFVVVLSRWRAQALGVTLGVVFLLVSGHLLGKKVTTVAWWKEVGLTTTRFIPFIVAVGLFSVNRWLAKYPMSPGKDDADVAHMAGLSMYVWLLALMALTLSLGIGTTVHHRRKPSSKSDDSDDPPPKKWWGGSGVRWDGILIILAVTASLYAMHEKGETLKVLGHLSPPHDAPLTFTRRPKEEKSRRENSQSWLDTFELIKRTILQEKPDAPLGGKAAKVAWRWAGWLFWIYWCIMLPLLAYCWAGARPEKESPAYAYGPWALLALFTLGVSVARARGWSATDTPATDTPKDGPRNLVPKIFRGGVTTDTPTTSP